MLGLRKQRESKERVSRASVIDGERKWWDSTVVFLSEKVGRENNSKSICEPNQRRIYENVIVCKFFVHNLIYSNIFQNMNTLSKI